MKFNTEAFKKGLIKMKKGTKWVNLSLEEYHNIKASECGCGFNCCDNTLHMIDHETGVHYAGYISNGQLIWEAISSYESSGHDTPAPPCTFIYNIGDNETGVALDTTLSWASSTGATGYTIVMGTTPGGNEVYDNQDLGNILTVTFGTTEGMELLTPNTEYFVRIAPYNESGNNVNCVEISFTTIDNI